jgi:hypothetical protein
MPDPSESSSEPVRNAAVPDCAKVLGRKRSNNSVALPASSAFSTVRRSKALSRMDMFGLSPRGVKRGSSGRKGARFRV